MKSTYVLWRGPSAHNGKPIRLVITNLLTASANPKTGNMAQVWILPDEQRKLTDIVKNGDDESVCGSCALRHFLAKKRKGKEGQRHRCYVQTHQAPNSVHRSTHNKPTQWLEGVNAMKASRKRVRVGAYGGLDALPPKVATDFMNLVVAL